MLIWVQVVSTHTPTTDENGPGIREKDITSANDRPECVCTSPMTRHRDTDNNRRWLRSFVKKNVLRSIEIVSAEQELAGRYTNLSSVFEFTSLSSGSSYFSRTDTRTMFSIPLAILLLVLSQSTNGVPKFETIPLRFDVIIGQLRAFYQRQPDLVTDLIEMSSAFMRPEELLIKASFSANQSTVCERDLELLITAASERQLWALKVFDAWGKPLPSGLLKGNTFWIGNYDECVNALYQPNNKSFVQQPFDTQYCASLFFPAIFRKKSVFLSFSSGTLQYNPIQDPSGTTSGLVVGVCLPASCTRHSIVALAHELLPMNNSTDDNLHCSNDHSEEQKGLSVGAIVISVVLLLLVSLVLTGTIIDLVVHHHLNVNKVRATGVNGYLDLSAEDSNTNLLSTAANQSLQLLIKQMPLIMFIAEFSAIRTLRRIFTINAKEKDDAFTFINGIRVLSLFWVILGHSFIFGIRYTSNISDMLTASRNIAFQLISSAVFSVDTFFLLSGFLTAVIFVRQVRKDKLSCRLMILYYIHRYIRLTPSFILVMFVSIYLTPYFGHGPFYPTEQGFEPTGCRDGYWWTSLVYVGNLVKPDNMCLSVTWYLFNDMQFHWIAPLALIPFAMGRKVIGYIVTTLFVVVSIGSILGLLLYYPSLVTHGLDMPTNEVSDIIIVLEALLKS